MENSYYKKAKKSFKMKQEKSIKTFLKKEITKGKTRPKKDIKIYQN